MKDFYQLTPFGRVRRLRRLAERALQEYDLVVARLQMLTYEWNTMFRVDTLSGERFVLRVCIPNVYSKDEVRSELMWLSDLAERTSFILPRPIPGKCGETVLTIAVDGVPEPRNVCLFSWVPGRDIAEDLNPDTFRLMGGLMAQLHNSALLFEPPAGFEISVANTLYHPRDIPVLMSDAGRQHMDPAMERIYETAVARVETAVDALFKQSGRRVLHADLHQWNVKLYRGKVFPIDFEDLTWGYPIQDIATTFYYQIDHPQQAILYRAFQVGYSAIAPWPAANDEEIGIFCAHRALNLVNYMVSSTDPADQEIVPEFVARTAARLARFLYL